MTSPILQNLEKMLAAGKDNPLLRFSLGNEYLKQGEPGIAASHFREALTRDPNYSAAWKLLGKSLNEAGKLQEAAEAYRSGITVAETRGDKQAAKEMAVFLRRVEGALSGSDLQEKGGGVPPPESSMS